MSQEIKLGQLIEGPGHKDAIHIAIAPVMAGVDLQPGQHVGFINDYDYTTVGPCGKPIGIIDPYLKSYVPKGKRCNLLLYPNTVTSLRHEWTHPAFGINDSEKWLREFAAKYYIDFDDLIQEATDVTTGCRDSICLGNDWDYDSEDERQFWTYFHQYTGISLGVEQLEGGTFRCAC